MDISANATLLKLLSQAVEQAYGNYGVVTLVQLNSTFGVLPINPGLTDLSLIGASVGKFFMDGQFAVPQACTFPISGKLGHTLHRCLLTAEPGFLGQYGFLNRLLFYTLLCFSVMFRKTLWLSGAALGVVMTYSSCAAVSAIVAVTLS